ncbi:glycosyltransferase family 4 protein [Clostridium swellfunianum]|uniref:glycosyltransferase family 4 protein n=1 Tax=Clostridium swellfunianum TaxID=1367462 RepID=UPI0020300DB3|nr:glycosyltransferase family 4 protein [Clostridium swellfunianum]MCM0647415.1 glycosyltransferase family 4 protein [Clostridium swellfunianum]
MKVLMIGPHRKLKGGVSTVVNNYFKAGLQEKINLKYIPTSIEGSMLKNIFFFMFALINITCYLAFKKIDVAHIHMASRGSFYRKSLIVLICSVFRKQIVIHLHGAEFDVFYHKESNASKRKYISYILNKADCIIALSEEWKEKISIYCNSKVEVVYNSVDIPKANFYKNGSRNLLFLGRIGKRKGVFDIIRALSEVKKLGYNFKLLVCGDGEVEQLKNLTKEYNMQQDVIIHGWISGDSKDELLKNIGINLLPSYNEGMPMSVLEAMSYGIPTIASNVGGIPKIIEHGINGYVIEPGDIELLKKYIILLLGDQDLREELSRKSYNTVKGKFDIEVQLDKLLKIYKSL